MNYKKNGHKMTNKDNWNSMQTHSFAFYGLMCVCWRSDKKNQGGSFSNFVLWKKKKKILNLQIPRNHWVLPSALRNSNCQIEFAFDTIHNYFFFLSFIPSFHVMSWKKCWSNASNKSVSIAIETSNKYSNGNCCRWKNKELK